MRHFLAKPIFFLLNQYKVWLKDKLLVWKLSIQLLSGIYGAQLRRKSDLVYIHGKPQRLDLCTTNNDEPALGPRYDLFSLFVIRREGLCPSSGDINRLLMMMNNAELYGR
jgi:hypothetical protein